MYDHQIKQTTVYHTHLDVSTNHWFGIDKLNDLIIPVLALDAPQS